MVGSDTSPESDVLPDDGVGRRRRAGRPGHRCPAVLPAVSTGVGTAYAPEEIAGQKTLALFNRAAERDFVDVRNLAARFGGEVLLRRAREIDAGFDVDVFADMIDMLGRFTDAELPTDAPDELRTFFAEWAAALRRR